MFHILGQTCGLATLLAGGTLILQPRINLDAAFDAIQRFRAKTMIGVPALYRMILEHYRLDQYDLSSVEYWFCAGDVLPVEIGKRIKAYVVLKEDIKGITGYELIKWCRQNLVSCKIPRYIEFRDMLPKSKVGKLLRREIRGEEMRRKEG